MKDFKALLTITAAALATVVMFYFIAILEKEQQRQRDRARQLTTEINHLQQQRNQLYYKLQEAQRPAGQGKIWRQ